MAMHRSLLICLPLQLLLQVHLASGIYIPPGPKYPCPEEKNQVYPCVCVQSGDTGIVLHCSFTNLASLSVGVNNALVPIDHLVIANAKINRLYGPVFHGVAVRRLTIVDTPLQYVERDAFWGVNQTMQQLELSRTELVELPVEAFSVLTNLSSLRIDGSRLQSVPSNALNGLRELEKVALSNANISQLMSDAFLGLDKLKSLDLHGNALTQIPKGIFQVRFVFYV